MWPATHRPPWTRSKPWPMAAATWPRWPPRPRARRGQLLLLAAADLPRRGAWRPSCAPWPRRPGRERMRAAPGWRWSCWPSSRPHRERLPAKRLLRRHPDRPARPRPPLRLRLRAGRRLRLLRRAEARPPTRGRRARCLNPAGDCDPGRPPPDDVAGIRARWAEVIASASPAIKPLLSECRPVALDGARLTLAFPEERGFMREKARTAPGPSSSCWPPCWAAAGPWSASPATSSSSR